MILFGSVQVTMILAALWQGDIPQRWEWVGLFLAFGGLIYLVSPGLAAPPLAGAGLMVASGLLGGFIPSSVGALRHPWPVVLQILRDRSPWLQ